jgi:hypothetical protein
MIFTVSNVADPIIKAMDIHFYLNDQEVRKVLFKQFSSRAHTWFQLIEKNTAVLQKEKGSLHLKYLPANNEVIAIYDKTSPVVQLLNEEANRNSATYLRHTELMPKLSY